jgi:hypothetical protein
MAVPRNLSSDFSSVTDNSTRPPHVSSPAIPAFVPSPPTTPAVPSLLQSAKLGANLLVGTTLFYRLLEMIPCHRCRQSTSITRITSAGLDTAFTLTCNVCGFFVVVETGDRDFGGLRETHSLNSMHVLSVLYAGVSEQQSRYYMSSMAVHTLSSDCFFRIQREWSPLMTRQCVLAD